MLESSYKNWKENCWFGKHFVRNLFQGHHMESRYQHIVPSRVVWTRHRHITPRLILSLIWVQDSRSSGTRGLLLIWAAISCQCQKTSWNGWISSGQMILQKDMWKVLPSHWQTDMSPITSWNYLLFWTNLTSVAKTI